MVVSPKLTPSQNKLLLASGVKSLYQLVTYMPFRYDIIAPYGTQLLDSEDVKIKHFLHGTLVGVQTRYMGKRKYLVLTIESEMRTVTGYMFTVARFTIKSLVVGQQYYFVLAKQGGYVVVEKSTKTNIMGLVEGQNTILPVYSKLGLANSAFLQGAYRRLDRSDMALDLRGLVSSNNKIIPETLDLIQVHRPQNIEIFWSTKKELLALSVYLKLVTKKYHEDHKVVMSAPAPSIVPELVSELKSNFPFDLSDTQNNAIDELVSRVSS